jgi:hypothetical protein
MEEVPDLLSPSRLTLETFELSNGKVGDQNRGVKRTLATKFFRNIA